MANRAKTSPRPGQKRIAAEKRGRRAEFIAAWFLRFKGYRIIERRFRTKSGEVDLIARKGDLVAMIEVKARQSLGQAHDAVGHTAQQRIISAGDYWLAKQADYARLSIRYDIIAIVPHTWPHHIKGAWEG